MAESLMREHAEKIYTGAIRASLPDSAVKKALAEITLPSGRLILVSIGKAGYRMALAANNIVKQMGGKIDCGAVITKYNHAEGKIEGLEIYEAAHPIPDEAGVLATERVLALTEGLTCKDTVLFLVSGGGSALFESPRCSLAELRELTGKLLASGADINEINAVRKHISKVKGGRFAEHVAPAKIFAVVLSDVIGDRLDTIASGPSAPDMSTVEEVKEILDKYNIDVSDTVKAALMRETPKKVDNATHYIGGSVSEMCRAAKEISESLGYETEILSDCECGIAREVGERLAKVALDNADSKTPKAFIVGGESVVLLKGDGLGGRNQEITLAASILLRGQKNVALFSVGSDGTDGPTDAAGGYVDRESYEKMTREGISPENELENNNSYNALSKIEGLIFTGPTGTNVNDIAVALVNNSL